MSGSKQPKSNLMTARGLSTLRKIRGMENLVVDVVEWKSSFRLDYLFPSRFPSRGSLDVPSRVSYFKPEKVQGFARMLTEEMNWKEETPEEGILQSKLKSKKSKPVGVSKTRTLRSGKIQKSASTPKKKVTKKAKTSGKRN
ncbi:hypothetical protein EAE96_009373 [Botrytis aclada]|nr:hypothetical protein EAE96_009373 [Botrytis aclada]